MRMVWALLLRIEYAWEAPDQSNLVSEETEVEIYATCEQAEARRKNMPAIEHQYRTQAGEGCIQAEVIECGIVPRGIVEAGQ